MKKTLSLSLIVLMLSSGCANNMSGNETAGTLIGGATGALVGSAFGRGTGKLIGTGVGAVAGALVGNSVGKSLDNNNDPAKTNR